MTKPLADGYLIDRVYDDLDDSLVQQGDKLAVALADLLDGDGQFDDALRALTDLVIDNAGMVRVVSLLRSKNHAKAELAAMRLAAADKGAFP